MRVLLFVQTGDGRPKCVETPGWLSAKDAQHVREMSESHATPDSPHWIQVLDHADRWWLVECLDAKHGRAVIAGSRTLDSAEFGRILASGGGKS